MKFEEIFDILRKGRLIRRKSWHRQECVKIHGLMIIVKFVENPINFKFRYYTLSLDDLDATDWEDYEMKDEVENEDKSIQESNMEQRETEILDENVEKILEEEINEKALKIGRKVLDEIYLHDIDKIKVRIRKKSNLFNFSIVEVGVHSVTGLFDNEIKFIKEGNLKEKY